MTWLSQPLVALDTETTGTDPETARILTCCIGRADQPGDWEPSEWRINPGVPVGDSVKIHGITDEMAATYKEPGVSLSGIRVALEDVAANRVPIVGHNLAYDLTALDREMRRHLGVALPDGLLLLDTLILFRRFDLSTGGRRLGQLASQHGITFPAHDATADALASLRLLHVLARDNDLLPLVPVADLQPLQAKWHHAQQKAARYKRIANGQSGDGFDTDWPIRPFVAQEAVA